ncbi:NAD(P)-dependent oxidoreductase [Saccharibacillus deserti]|uniref:NAD(P)-dependent oxidoreductase n=1 Tax=Saccharibacillus deserti TaxID=1634444 RepID=UPI0015575614|nr:SDR family oxidoreductase [Saccharibacillus deserti]
MRIGILGATGRVGKKVVEYALQDGHRVTALVRDPGKIEPRAGLAIIEGSALSKEDVGRVLQKTEAVISALNTDGTTTLSASTPLIIEAMHEVGIKRLITIGTAGILQSRTDPHLLRYESSESKRRSTRAAEEHRRMYEQLQASGLDWTIVCPTYLPDGEAIGNYRTERDVLPEGGSQISVGDTAEFAYGQIADSRYLRARVGIAY